MKMDSKLKYIIFILSIVCHEVACECEYELSNCTTNVYCSSGLYLSLEKLGNRNYGYRNYGYGNEDHCSNRLENYNGYNLYPTHLFIKAFNNIPGIIPEHQDSFLLNVIVSLHVTYSALETAPQLYRMERLKLLNLSYNNLHDAALFNRVDLSKLEEIDLSHNKIDFIQVDQNQHVYKNILRLNLSHNVLTSVPDGAFELFKYLEILDLSYNNLETIDPATFEGLKSLKCLYLSHNTISDLYSSLFRFTYLKKLFLDNNKIQHLSFKDLEKLEQLETLDLGFNQISRIEQDTFNSTVSLTTLKLHNNLLDYINKDAFISTNSLQDVDLSYNLLRNLPKDLFKNKNVNSFSITHNLLKGSIARGTFEGLQLITELDLSYQEVTSIEEYAFFGLEVLKRLLLNNNKIGTISKNAFMSLKNLIHLDLSNNLLTQLGLDVKDLLSLEYLSVGNNFIGKIEHDDFLDLKRLVYLDLSYNNISTLEPNSFTTAKTIESFQILHNPLSGKLLKNTFDGLSLVPLLDLSCTSLKEIQNESFSGMIQLQDLNISRSSVNVLEYDAFMNTGSLQLLDLSHNELTQFLVNTNDLKNLTTIFLNNNNLVHISNDCFKNINFISKLILSYNSLHTIDTEAFANQTGLRYLDLSFNYNLTFDISVIEKARYLEKLYLSGLNSEVNFLNMSSVHLKHLEISHLRIYNLSEIHLSMKYLTHLTLNNNNVAKLDLDAFKNLNLIQSLDLSFNNISFIQPGSFKNNVLLSKLNLSHNSLIALNYGIFRGLASLNSLDVSFNSINDLRRERFYDTPNLRMLIVDHNKITDVGEDFFNIDLMLLSIGDNPLPCEKIVTMKHTMHFQISAMYIDEHNGDNVDGITCNNNNNKNHIYSIIKSDATNSTDNDRILLELKEILLNLSTKTRGNKYITENEKSAVNNMKEIFNKIDKYEVDQTKGQMQLKNITSEVADKVERSNLFLERILRAIQGLGSSTNKSKIISSNAVSSHNDNGTVLKNNSDLINLITNVNEVKQELLYLENLISEMDRKILLSKTESTPLVAEKFNKTDIVMDRNKENSFVFVEVCVSLILIILVCFCLYKFYQAKMFVSTSRSLSTRHITESIDNSNL